MKRLLIIIAFLCLVGCEMMSGEMSGDYPGSGGNTPTTAQNIDSRLVGIWQRQYTHKNSSGIITEEYLCQYTFKADGTGHYMKDETRYSGSSYTPNRTYNDYDINWQAINGFLQVKRDTATEWPVGNEYVYNGSGSIFWKYSNSENIRDNCYYKK